MAGRLHRQVAVLVQGLTGLRVEHRRPGHGQDAAGFHIEDHHPARFGLGTVDCGETRLLRLVLQREVDGGVEVGSGD